MSPIIDIQRRMVEAGRIRAGDTSNGHPRKLDKWRLTSKDRVRLEAAAQLWGGAVKEWEGHAGEFELYTETDSLPIMLLPETEPSLYYELWTRGGCQRRCDGQTELISDGACLCNAEARDCKPHLRFPVLLPDLQGIGSWLVQSTGWNAANEIPGSMALLSRATARGVLMPARLRLEQRVDVKEGKTRRFAVPVVDVDVSFRELLSLGGELTSREQAALPTGYTPIAPASTNGVSLEEGLAVAETQTLARNARSSAPIPSSDEDIPFGTGPVPVPDDPGALASPPTSAPSDVTPSGAPATPRSELPTKRMLTKLDVLVGTLRDTLAVISTEQLYSALAKSRNIDVALMIDVTDGAYGTDGVLHWAPLRDSLTRAEASDLVDRLTKLEANVPKAAA